MAIRAGYTVDSWPGLGRHGKAEKFNCPSHRQLLPHFNERTHARTLQPAAARCARYALPRKDAVSSAHRTRRTREIGRAFQHVSVRFAGNWNSSDPKAENRSPVRSLSAEVGGEEPATRIHWWPLSIDPAPSLCRPHFATHFRQRAEEAGRWRRG